MVQIRNFLTGKTTSERYGFNPGSEKENQEQVENYFYYFILMIISVEERF